MNKLILSLLLPFTLISFNALAGTPTKFKNKIVLISACSKTSNELCVFLDSRQKTPMPLNIDSSADLQKITDIMSLNGGTKSLVKVLVDGFKASPELFDITMVHREVSGYAQDPLGAKAGAGKICATCADVGDDIVPGTEGKRCEHGELQVPICFASF
jgi:hypothetical protein